MSNFRLTIGGGNKTLFIDQSPLAVYYSQHTSKVVKNRVEFQDRIAFLNSTDFHGIFDSKLHSTRQGAKPLGHKG